MEPPAEPEVPTGFAFSPASLSSLSEDTGNFVLDRAEEALGRGDVDRAVRLYHRSRGTLRAAPATSATRARLQAVEAMIRARVGSSNEFARRFCPSCLRQRASCDCGATPETATTPPPPPRPAPPPAAAVPPPVDRTTSSSTTPSPPPPPVPAPAGPGSSWLSWSSWRPLWIEWEGVVGRTTGLRGDIVRVLAFLAVAIAVAAILRLLIGWRPLLSFGHLWGDLSMAGSGYYVSAPMVSSLLLSLGLSFFCRVFQRPLDRVL